MATNKNQRWRVVYSRANSVDGVLVVRASNRQKAITEARLKLASKYGQLIGKYTSINSCEKC